MALSPQTLTEAERRVVAAWAADCAERVLPLFEAEAPDDDGTRSGIERARAYARGELDTATEIRNRFRSGRPAHAVSAPAAVAAARSAAQAAAVSHMGAHALGAAAYAAKAAGLAAPDAGVARVAELAWQLGRMSPAVRAALAKLPALGSDAAGPLGPGLLTRGAPAESIRALQAAIVDRGSD
ncbi:putative immunity protein [Microbacterium gorillae]|uniref:putative immunity protein n=1 Tax=Microbacterium gorillae TaxID=1231063 RepID=UPI0005912B55|nr:hypothetical protein [Microbacterium gorillae]